MKCPQCVKEGKKSCVQVGERTTTLAFFSPFYDTEGVYHHHDSNTTTQYYRCDRGHFWSENVSNTCPNPNCDWTSESQAMAPPEIKEDTAPLNQITGDGGASTAEGARD